MPRVWGALEEERVDFASRTAWPDRPRPQVTRYRVWGGRCTVCGTQVRGQHPDLAPDHDGATAHRLGPPGMAAGHALHYGVGLPVRQGPAVVAALTGVQLTPGARTQDALRRAVGAVGTAYAQLRAALPAAPIVHTDDTGWRVGGAPAALMACETDAATVSQIRPRHRHEAGQEVIAADDDGVRVTDRGRRDDAREFEGVAPQKCLAHLLRSIDDVLAPKQGRARDFGEQLKGLGQEARARWHAPWDGQTDLKAEAEALQAEVTHPLRDRWRRDADNQRLLKEWGWHHDQGNVLRFVADPRLEPTNNRAERALRPAVIARNVSQGSKNGGGAHAFAAFTSVVRTLAKNGIDSLVEGLSQLFGAPNVPTCSSLKLHDIRAR